jgi:cardiolipin synthase
MTRQNTDIPRPPARSDRQFHRRAQAWKRKHARQEIKHPPRKSRLGEAGTARGQRVEVGCIDAGWTMPPPVTLRDGTTVQFYKDGQGLTAAYNAIDRAREQVCLEVYIFHSDDTGRAFAKLLADKAAAGINVFVIYDSFGSIDSDPAMFEMMRRAGVRLAEFHPLRPWDAKFAWRPFNRDHRKLLVIDNRVAGLGGLNVGMEYGSGFLAPKARKCDLWRDNGIGIVGPGAATLAECFARTWNYVQHGGKIARARTVHNITLGPPPTRRRGAERQRWEQSLSTEKARHAVMTGNPPPADQVPRLKDDLAVLASVPSPKSAVAPMLTTFIRSARQSLDLTIAYFAPSDDLIEELMSAAGRGVRVRLMLPGRSDVALVRFAAHAFYRQLLEAGVEIDKKMSLDFWQRRPLRDRLIQWAASRARYLL